MSSPVDTLWRNRRSLSLSSTFVLYALHHRAASAVESLTKICGPLESSDRVIKKERVGKTALLDGVNANLTQRNEDKKILDVTRKMETSPLKRHEDGSFNILCLTLKSPQAWSLDTHYPSGILRTRFLQASRSIYNTPRHCFIAVHRSRTSSSTREDLPST